MGIRGKISRTTLAHANENRDWRIYADFAQGLIHSARDLYSNDPFCLDLKETVYALDATIIDLSLSLFPWAKFRTQPALCFFNKQSFSPSLNHCSGLQATLEDRALF